MAAAIDNIASAAPEVLTNQALTWPEKARAVQITSSEGLEQAAEMLRGIKDLRGEVNATFDPIVSKAFAAHREATAAKKRAEGPLAEAEQILRGQITGYQLEQERLRKEAERRARAEAEERSRQERERLAAEQRRAEEEARKAAEDQKLADALAAESEGAPPEEVEAILEAPVEVVPMVMPVSPAPVVAPVIAAAPRPAGISAPRENWSAEVDDLHALVTFVAANPGMLNLVQANTVALNQMARAQKQLLKIPGVRPKNNPTISVRGR